MDVRVSRSAGQETRTRLNAKYVVFAIVAVMSMFVLWNNERFFLNPRAPEWQHFNPIRWQLIPHGIGGTIALFLGAMQFSTRLRSRFPHLHRRLGKLYIAGTFVAAPVAIWMAAINSPWFLVPFTVIQAVTWVLFTLFAYVSIRRGAVRSHREWMTRSYAIVLIFLEGRVLMAIPSLAQHGMDAIVLVNWACLTITLVGVESLLRWREVFPRRPAIHRTEPTRANVV